MYKTKAYAAAGATSPLASTTISRRDATEHDVQIEILFCGTLLDRHAFAQIRSTGAARRRMKRSA